MLTNFIARSTNLSSRTSSAFLRSSVYTGRCPLFAYSKRNFALLDPKMMRNIGISAHIDSGKTTMTAYIFMWIS